MTANVGQCSYLIVNADDYGYYDCVSQGVLDAVENGIVTATGIFANSKNFDKHAEWIGDYETLDIGVHLNLTDGEPLSPRMRNKLEHSKGRFAGKYALVKALLSGALKREDVMLEWGAQIERCLNRGLTLRFLNSHEHIHMLPRLFELIQTLARTYEIPHIRFPAPDPPTAWSVNGLVRDAALTVLLATNRKKLCSPTARFVGMGASGRLNLDYLRKVFSQLEPGRIHELMCHPGYRDAEEIDDSRLLSYHDWEGEYRTLVSPVVKNLIAEHGIRLIGYRDLDLQQGVLVVRHETETPQIWGKTRI